MITPTIGIEIELPWRAMLARVDPEAGQLLAQSPGFRRIDDSAVRQRIQQGFSKVDELYADTVDAVFGDKIERAPDGYREFAFAPEAHHAELVETAAQLYERDILRGDEVYPLHVTLGHVPLKAMTWNVLMAMELVGGSTPERLTEQRTWSQKGQAGIKERSPLELKDATIGVELRSLAATGIDALERTLYVAQRAGSMLLHWLEDPLDPRNGWRDLTSRIRSGMAEQGIDVSRRWENPHIALGPWQSLANALRDKEWSRQMESDIMNLVGSKA